MQPDIELIGIPDSWQKGELLDQKSYQDGSFRFTRLGEKPKKDEDGKDIPMDAIDFPNREEAQEFISWWYSRERRQ